LGDRSPTNPPLRLAAAHTLAVVGAPIVSPNERKLELALGLDGRRAGRSGPARRAGRRGWWGAGSVRSAPGRLLVRHGRHAAPRRSRAEWPRDHAGHVSGQRMSPWDTRRTVLRTLGPAFEPMATRGDTL